MLRDDVTKELVALQARKRSTLKPQAVIDFAKSHPRSASYRWLASRGAWDKNRMAQRGLIDLAREMIRVYCVQEVETPRGPIRVRVFQALSSDRPRGGGYRTTASILRDSAKTQTLVADALKELNALKRKYANLNALIPIWKAMDEVERSNVLPDAAQSAA